ncbi:MAG TPA: hypothetical protein VFV24_00060, partial [Candidatus Eisenbacteria bacterium]|nr:hypothetical protein [Candidatus Eisenbacteria bacterium]
EVHEPAVREAIESLIARHETLGLLFCGSRATGWAAPDGDYDAFVYVTREHYRSLDVDQTQIRIFAEGETPKRMIGDFSLFSEEVFEEQLRSPLDIDHWPYVDAVIVSDKTGALAEWTRKLAAFPTDQLRERAVQKYLQLVIDYHYATIADVRGFEVDRRLNLNRAALAAVHLWFTLRGRWAPPLKWWTREVERLEIRPDTRAVLEGAILNPSIEMLTHCRDHMKSEMRHAGITEIDDLLRFFFTTFLPENRESVYRNTYL